MSELTTRAVELEGGLFVVPKGANKREALLTATCAVNSVKQRTGSCGGRGSSHHHQ